MKDAEKLITIYERLKELRQSGFKMKDIAAAVELPPSVLSALYAAVLPSFCELYGTKDFDEALEEALYNVNNLSKKRLMGSLEQIYELVTEIRPIKNTIENKIHPFFSFLKKESRMSLDKCANLEGIYMSYSCSSSVQTLKAEPYYLKGTQSYNCLTVGRKSVHNSIREGIGIVKEQQMLYLMMNAFNEPNISLLTIYLQLPFLEEINMLKGLYLVPDYNKNPIARRIVFVRLLDYYTPEAFEEIEAKLIRPEEFTEKEKVIFDYTCERSDLLKMCTLPSPKLDLRDLQAEKKLLNKEDEL